MREIVGLYELLENKDFEGFKMNSNNFYKLNFCGKNYYSISIIRNYIMYTPWNL